MSASATETCQSMSLATISNPETFSMYGSKVLPLYLKDKTAWLLDQTLLPNEKTFVAINSVTEMANAISTMIVRGAPAIGISAAYGLVLSINTFMEKTPAATVEDYKKQFEEDKQTLFNTRPTAVNLGWALTEMTNVLTKGSLNTLTEIETAFRQKALEIHQQDVDACKAMGDFGASLIKSGSGILTHCNAGALATGAYGTALGVIRSAYQNDSSISVFADETRPRQQGAKLTTWELVEDNIPVTLICDNMAASLMASGKIQAVVVGADRITANGDVANKIGTYGVAVLAHAHNIPFYVAAPKSTFDLSLNNGSDIPIEYRNSNEVSIINGVSVAASNAQFLNPGFDVTPAKYISAIITEHGIIRPDFKENIAKTLQ